MQADQNVDPETRDDFLQCEEMDQQKPSLRATISSQTRNRLGNKTSGKSL